MPLGLDRFLSPLQGQPTLGTLLERLAKLNGNRRMVEEAGGGLDLTYAQAAKRVARWAAGMAQKAEPGSRVVIATGNGYEMLLLCLAASRAGMVPVPVNPQMRPEEIRHVVSDSGASLNVRTAAEVDGPDLLTETVPADPSDIAALFYTSGTTGKPKGVQQTHKALVGGFSLASVVPPQLLRVEAVIALPIAHIMGFAAALGLASAGIAVYFLPKFRPDDVLDAIESRRAAIFIGVPAMYRMMLEAGAERRDLKSVRVWVSGADAMPADLAARYKKLGATVTLPVFGSRGEAVFADGYGMVETGGGAVMKVSPPFLATGLGSDAVGFPLPGYRLRVVGEDGGEVGPGATGELLIKGPGITTGYWGDAGATGAVLTDDGWLRTGDLARKGPLGTVLFAGRAKDVIKSGGYSVYAAEVERALEEHPDVLEAAVVGLPDERKGEVPAAAVRLRSGVTLDEARLDAWANDKLARYKVPVRFVAVEELPRTGTNKVQKRELLPLFLP
ncbi:MAG: class I adenylate-forming enzyme family protein, partial [Acidimicrobiales bacterium]